MARFVLSVVEEELDLSAIMSRYSSEKGQPPFHPAMMTALLVYACCSGVYSSRRIAKACGERVDFMSIVGLDAPDFRTIADFRKRHLPALVGQFVQVLALCAKAGLTKLGHVAFDGSKIRVMPRNTAEAPPPSMPVNLGSSSMTARPGGDDPDFAASCGRSILGRVSSM